MEKQISPWCPQTNIRNKYENIGRTQNYIFLNIVQRTKMDYYSDKLNVCSPDNLKVMC